MVIKGAILAIGSELLLGDVINSNAAWIGHQLAAAGVEVIASEALADSLERLVPAIHRHLLEADVLIVCGGLGPTVDDLTREALAAALNAPLARAPELEVALAAAYHSFGLAMPAEVLRQADVPTGAQVLTNPAGTAPGLWLTSGDRVVVALPGPPHELRAVGQGVWPRLAAMSGTVVTTRQVLVVGLGESQVATQVQQALSLPAGVALSYLAGGAIVRVRFTTSADPAVLTPLVALVDAALGAHVWGHDEQTLDGVVHAALGALGQTVAVAESLTGGLLGAALSQQPGSSATFRGSAVVYATDLKATMAGVPEATLATHGAVSGPTAAALASGIRTRLNADWGIGVTGVAGPSEQEGKAVGTVIVAVAGPDGAGQVRALRLPGDRDRVRQMAVTQALDLLRRQLR